MKVIGAVCVMFGACLWLAISQQERRRRRETLSDLYHVLFRMAEEIRLARVPFPIILERLTENCQKDIALFLRAVAQFSKEGEHLESAWKAAAESLPLEEREKRIISDLSEDLRGDEGGVLKALLAAAEILKKRSEEVERLWFSETRRTTAFVISAAALLVILLF